MDHNKKSVLDINILGKDYKIGCSPEHKDSLIKSGQFLDLRMRQMRDKYQIVGLDKIAVLAALHISHELLNGNQTNNDRGSQQYVQDKINELTDMLTATINDPS